MKAKYLVAMVASLAIFGCESKQATEVKEEKVEMKMEKIELSDPHSYSKPDIASQKHLNWEAKIDFENKVIEATATYTIDRAEGANEIIFDTKNLTIASVTDVAGEELEYQLKDADAILGSALVIALKENTDRVSIAYTTSQGAAALQFLDPEQTAGKKHPFLFTQSQAILARTWIPIQDSPGIRFTYEAAVEVPKGMLALMSAENPTELSEDGIYTFKMEQAVPSYLMALSVGNIEYRSLVSETGVYAEPELIDAAAYEFADMQNMVDTAEALYGPYRWGIYDVIVLPPSFPFGGMENPRLTFATPTIIAGDRSLTALIAHELAHSWSGNLVTNVNWEDIWLNEGFTVYFENRIMEEIFGADFANMLAILAHQDLVAEVEDLSSNGRAADTRLKVDLEGRDPDEGLTAVPYDKGFYLLKLIEQTVGRDNWDAFLKDYFNTFAFQVMNTKSFVQYLNDNLLSQNQEWAAAVRLDEWVYQEGIPDNIPVPQSTKFEEVNAQLELWKNGTSSSELETEGWSTPQWLYFIRSFPAEMDQEQMSGMDATFGFTKSGNREIQSAWFEKVLPNNYAPADAEAEDFLIVVGRRKFLVPIYKAILASEAGHDRAMEIYVKARPNYHAVSRVTLDQILNYEG